MSVHCNYFKRVPQTLYARYLCSRYALGLKAERARPSARATIGYLVYKTTPIIIRLWPSFEIIAMHRLNFKVNATNLITKLPSDFSISSIHLKYDMFIAQYEDNN